MLCIPEAVEKYPVPHGWARGMSLSPLLTCRPGRPPGRHSNPGKCTPSSGPRAGADPRRSAKTCGRGYTLTCSALRGGPCRFGPAPWPAAGLLFTRSLAFQRKPAPSGSSPTPGIPSDTRAPLTGHVLHPLTLWPPGICSTWCLFKMLIQILGSSQCIHYLFFNIQRTDHLPT